MVIDVVYVVLDHLAKHTELVSTVTCASSDLSRGLEVDDEWDERTSGKPSECVFRGRGKPNPRIPEFLEFVNGWGEQVVDLR